jgi:NlpC/P60 family protein
LVTHVGIYEGAGVMVNASKRHGRVRRDDLNESYWAQRFMFARRVMADGDEARREGTEREDSGRTERRSSGRREAARALGRLAEALLRRVPR